MKICVDTNVILDVLLAREPWFPAAVNVLSEIETGKHEGYLCPTTLTTIAYLIQKAKGANKAKHLLAHLLSIFDLTELNKNVFSSALSHAIPDYEDAVLHESARLSGMDAIITRNLRDFRRASLLVYSPEEIP
ncbi:MAG: PIN domain-containing protein [Candidatus Neomarinimicrobiota bacterium]|nr:PIN domain-containing protein [Candidatus Neomarinimicrobiota bacterium]MDX9781024.1 PIN domain-containing protein [bacterium]